MADWDQAFAEIFPKLFEYTRCLGITWNAQVQAGTFRIIPLLVDAGGRGRCHIVVELADIVRYFANHFRAECSASRFYNNVL